MANPWFRLYSEFADDPKVQMMPESLQRRLVMLFCSRCKNETLHETERAFHWRISQEELSSTKAIFIEKGFIDESWNLLNWNRRQFLSDSSTDRVRRHREAKKHNKTLQKQDIDVTVTPPEQNRTEHKQHPSLFGEGFGPTDDPKKEVISKAWEYYKTVFKRSEGYDFSPARKTHAEKGWKTLLKKCESLAIPEEDRPDKILELFCHAIDNLKSDKFHNGENDRHEKYNDWENLFSSSKIPSPNKLTDYWLNESKFSDKNGSK